MFGILAVPGLFEIICSRICRSRFCSLFKTAKASVVRSRLKIIRFDNTCSRMIRYDCKTDKPHVHRDFTPAVRFTATAGPSRLFAKASATAGLVFSVSIYIFIIIYLHGRRRAEGCDFRATARWWGADGGHTRSKSQPELIMISGA